MKMFLAFIANKFCLFRTYGTHTPSIHEHLKGSVNIVCLSFKHITVCTHVMFTLFGQFSHQKKVQKLCEEFLEVVVLEVTSRLGPEVCFLFIKLK